MSPCLESTLAGKGNGYASKSIRRGGRRSTTTHHRWVWIETHGDPGPELDVHHVCGNRRCVNIEHLELQPARYHRSEHSASHWAGKKWSQCRARGHEPRLGSQGARLCLECKKWRKRHGVLSR